MINPIEITKYDRTESELEEFLLFSIMVAGKNSQQTAKKLESFLFGTMGLISPLDWIANLVKIKENKISSTDPLMVCMKNHKLGQYNRLFSAFTGILQFKGRLSTVTVQELESVKGIGPKTARFFVLHSRPNQEIAVLDTHILHWMRDNGIPAPKSTPSGEKYLELERKFIELAKNRGISIADLDLKIWTEYSSSMSKPQFQVGDRVKLKEPIGEAFRQHGQGEVVPYRGEHDPKHPRVRWSSGWAFTVKPKDIEHLSVEEKQQPRIQLCHIDYL